MTRDLASWRWPVPDPDVRRACGRVAASVLHARGLGALADLETAFEEALSRLDRDAGGAGAEASIARLVMGIVGPDTSASVGSVIFDRRRRGLASAPSVGPDQMLRELLYACVHPTLPPDRQCSMLLRFGFWLPNDAVAKTLEISPSTVGIQLRQSCRRLRAVARRGSRARIAGQDSRCLSILDHLDRLRHRTVDMRRSSPGVVEAIERDILIHAALLLDTESGRARAETHAFLAELHLGTERTRRSAATKDPNPLLQVTTEPIEDAMAAGLWHLRLAQDQGAESRFVWLARIHASYLLASDRTGLDWQRMVGLYEGLLRVSTPDTLRQLQTGSSAA
jgi:predicted RNA polymerase sigma factor